MRISSTAAIFIASTNPMTHAQREILGSFLFLLLLAFAVVAMLAM